MRTFSFPSVVVPKRHIQLEFRRTARFKVVYCFRLQGSDSRFQVHDCCILYLWLGIGTHNCCVQAVAWYHVGACMATGHGSYIRCLGSYIRCLEHPASSSFPCQYILPVTVHALVVSPFAIIRVHLSTVVITQTRAYLVRREA